MLDEFLSASKAPLPEAATALKPKRAKKEKPVKIPDCLLCPELDEAARIVPEFDSGFESYTETA